MLKKNLPLLLILALGLFLRLIYLGRYPGGFAADEAVQAYDAYSLLQTGRDQWGVAWPVSAFRSFADYKAPLLTYLMLPSVAIFGLNEFATRLPSALMGTLAIFVCYLLTLELFRKFELKNLKVFGGQLNIGHLAAFILAISPWHLQFSRTALEANLVSLFFPLGLWAFLKAQYQTKYYVLAAVSWVLGLYSYHSLKVFLPLFLISLLIIYFRQLRSQLSSLILPGLVFLVLVTPLIYSSLFGSATRRGQELLLTNLSSLQAKSIADSQYFSPLNGISSQIPRLFTNKFTYFADKFSENYLSYFSPTFWFSEGGGDNSYHTIPGRGLLYLWLFPFAIWGLVSIFKARSSTTKVLLAWMLLAPIAAAITKEGYRPNRATAFLTFWEIIAGVGLLRFLTGSYQRLKTLLLVPVIFFSFLWYANDYLYNAPIHHPRALNYGYRDLMAKVLPLEDNYKQIIFDRGEENQIFVAFYKPVDPRDYQLAAQEWWDRFQQTDFLYTDMLEDYSLGKYRFKTINRSDVYQTSTLLVLRGDRLFDEDLLKPLIIDVVKYPNQDPAFYLISASTLAQKQ